MKAGVVERGSRFLERLTTREKLLILLMVAVFSLMATFVLVKRFRSSLSDLETEIHSYDQALALLVANQENVAARLERAEEIEAKLQDNDLQLHSFLEQQCIESNVDRPSSYNDNVIPQRDQSTGEARIVEVETRATINAVDPLPLSRLLNRIANSDELVLIKAIDLQPARGQPGRYRVDLTVSTYRLSEES